ncbi:hypothetical protein AJ80_02685 [Polytolypa hystricis UAMH7299]|uniref:Uncharacterized protein n=1 Tax=Polytolypa hystricis (strain UAMH7299) TaxID=1447883 RepID=A0A2B7YQF6_POLH7|nr:hypothetical protein AJ80_02685 [Polytolypa hystricis UAMH7299]
MSSTSAPAQGPSSTGSSGGMTPRTSSDSTTSSLHFDVVRCSRCQRSLSLENTGSSPGVVRFGINSYYCSRCASMTKTYSAVLLSIYNNYNDRIYLASEKEDGLAAQFIARHRSPRPTLGAGNPPNENISHYDHEEGICIRRFECIRRSGYAPEGSGFIRTKPSSYKWEEIEWNICK